MSKLNGDCFYLAIQLFIGQHYDPLLLTSVHFLRNEISNFLINASAGASILRTYNHNHDIIVNTLLNLKPASFPNQDTFAQDYAIAAMATFLGTTIKIYTTHDTTPILHIFTPYPNPTPLSFLPSTPPPISLWADRNHFQLLLNTDLSFPSLTNNLLPLPLLPSKNTDLQGKRIIITPPTSHNFKSPCPFRNHTHITSQKPSVTPTVINTAPTIIQPSVLSLINDSPQVWHLQVSSPRQGPPKTLPSLKYPLPYFQNLLNALFPLHHIFTQKIFIPIHLSN